MKIKRFLVFLLITICFICNSTLSFAMDNITTFRRMTIEDGLSQGSVECIFQDSRGYLWFGTTVGLNRYDGHSFKIYKSKGSDLNSLTGNYIDAIVEDRHGYIWAATSKGLNKIDVKNDKITRYTHVEGKEGSLPNNNIWELMIDKDGQLWCAAEGGVARYVEKTDSFEKVQFDDSNASKNSNFATSIFQDSKGLIWVGTKDGLKCIDKNTLAYKSYYKDGNNNESLYIQRVFEDSKGELWIGTKDFGLMKFNKENLTFENINSDKNNDIYIGKSIQAIFEDSAGYLWIGSNSGLSTYDRKNNKFTIYTNDYYDNQSLVNNDVRSIIQDKSGVLWIGTYNGISYFQANQSFKHYKRNLNDKYTLSDNMISSIYMDERGVLWIGTCNGGVDSFDRNTGKIVNYKYANGDKNSLADNEVVHLSGDKEGNIWIATNSGLSRIDTKTNVIRNFNKSDGLSSDEVKFILIDSNDTVWVSTRNGVNIYNRTTDKFYNYDSVNFEGNYIGCMFEDHKGNMWFGTAIDGGLFKVEKGTNKVQIYKYIYGDKEGLSSNTIKSINEDNLNNIWVATTEGINKIDTASGKINKYTEADGLINDYTYCILIDKFNNPWISSNRGLSKFDTKGQRFINFCLIDGLQNSEFNINAAFKSKDGEMFFGGINGFNSFFPEKIVESEFLPKVQLMDFKIYDRNISISDEIHLKYNENYFSIDFFLPDYRNPKENQYAYQLEGVDKDWIEAKDRNFATYTNVEAGKYTFKVKGKGSNGQWGEETKINIVVGTPPWKSKWAYALYTLTILAIIMLSWNYVYILDNLVKQRTYQLNKKLEENKLLYDKVISYERIKNKYFINLSHELRTPLNIILSSLQVLQKYKEDKMEISEEKLHNYMSIINRNASRLLKVINDLIDTSKIDAGQYRLNFSNEDIVYLVEEIALSMKEYIEGKGINLIIDPEVEEKQIKCDATEVERIVINLLSNAAKFTPVGGTIWVKLFDYGDKISFSIKDTGIGIAEENHKLIFNRFGQVDSSESSNKLGSGIGLTLVKSLVEMHGGTIELKSKLHEGSEFIVTLPVDGGQNSKC